MIRRNFLAGSVFAGLLATHGAARAQFGDLGNVVKGLGTPKLPKVLSGPEPVSTNIKDAI